MSLLHSARAARRRARPAQAGAAPAADERAVFRGAALPWLLLAPTMLVLAVFIYLPALRTLNLAAYRANVILGTRQFVGLENFTALLQSPAYLQVAAQTLLFTALSVGLGLLLSL